ncbi:hypothetical protein [Zobellia nedashkovskayae]|uniref:hypothetical protein n=1 Tax=Zobellia nedashkovskayae TaxID=2779510 RepID=UPI00188A72AD|nr:hypothetical protein [Zobellia nedashkovskayae]
MIKAAYLKVVFFGLVLLITTSYPQKDTQASNVPQSANEVTFTSVLNAHLNAVSTKNLEAIKLSLLPKRHGN